MNLENQNNISDDIEIVYDSSVTSDFFQLFGKPATVKQRKTIFSPEKKGGFFSSQDRKMYFLVEGKVNVQTDEHLLPLKTGEVFGEFSPFHSENSTITTNKDCKFITLTEKQLLVGFKSNPEIMFMLMSLFSNYLRRVNNTKKLSQKNAPTKHEPLTAKDQANSLDPKVLEELVKIIGDDEITEMSEKQVVFREGGSAMLMYVIIKGYVRIFVGKQAVGRSGPGGIVGEIALIDGKPRTASVMTETNCSVLAVNRQTLFALVGDVPAFGTSLLRVLSSHLC